MNFKFILGCYLRYFSLYLVGDRFAYSDNKYIRPCNFNLLTDSGYEVWKLFSMLLSHAFDTLKQEWISKDQVGKAIGDGDRGNNKQFESSKSIEQTNSHLFVDPVFEEVDLHRIVQQERSVSKR